MAYIGTPAVDRFTASKAASVYSGDGSTTAFTLEHSVGADEDILVSVDGVIQEPSVAYAVSSGTTLTFTAAPSTNSGNNIFVYYLFSTLGTVTHPATSALSATSGTFSGTLAVTGASTLTGTVTANGDMVLGGTTPTLTIGDAGAEDAKIVFDGNAQDYHIGLDDSADTLVIGKGSALGTTTAMSFDANGIITKPLQPAFMATVGSDSNNFAKNTNVTIPFATEIFDQNADYNNSNYTFTAPVTGRYQINVILRLGSVDDASAYYYLELNTSNRSYFNIFDPDFGQDAVFWVMNTSILADMDAGDTAKALVLQENSGQVQTDIQAASFFSGHLVC